MMLKEKSNPWARLKYLYVLPVAAIAVTAFARPEISNELKEISAVKVNDLSSNVKTENQENTLTEISFTESEIQTSQPEVVPETIVPEVNNNQELQEPQQIIKSDSLIIEHLGETKDGIKVIGYGTQKGTELNGRVVSVSLPMAKLNNTLPNSEPLIILDGEVISQNVLSVVDASRIESVSVLKSEAATNMYGEAAKSGVVLITTKNDGKSTISFGSSDTPEGIRVKGTVKDEDGKPVIGASVLIKGTNKGTISDLDGNFILDSPEESEIVVMYIDMKTVTAKAQPEMNVVLKPE